MHWRQAYAAQYQIKLRGKETKYNKEIGEGGTTKDPSPPHINPHPREATSKDASTKIRTFCATASTRPIKPDRPNENKDSKPWTRRKKRRGLYLEAVKPTTNKRVNRPAPKIPILSSSLFLTVARMVQAWRGYIITLHATQTRTSPILNIQHPTFMRAHARSCHGGYGQWGTMGSEQRE